MADSYDVIIIGAGPGGYVCAIRCGQLGLKTAIIEKRSADAKGGPSLGGTCLNVGCIPSKALLDSSEHFHNASQHFSDHGIDVGKPKIDVGQMMKRKTKVVKDLTGGVGYLMKKNKVTVVAGTGKLTKDGGVSVTGPDDKTTELKGKHIVLAMGSVPIELPFLPFDKEHIVSSDQAIAFDEVPEKLVVVGGGVIGLELGSVWGRLGSQVTVLEFMDQIIPGYDADVAKGLQKTLKKMNMSFELETKVTGAETQKGTIKVQAENKQGEAVSFEADKVLVAVGRRPYTEHCGLEDAGVEFDERKRIAVDEEFRTSAANVFAIGDLIHGPMLAHKAEEEGVAVAEIIAGQKAHVDHLLVPGVVYTWPEVAMVGLSETAAKETGRELAIGKFQFMANGRAKASGDVDGFVKVIADKQTDELLGVTILGARASDLITEATTVMAFGGSAEDIALICHAHPTFSEGVKEAALDALGRMLHS